MKSVLGKCLTYEISSSDGVYNSLIARSSFPDFVEKSVRQSILDSNPGISDVELSLRTLYASSIICERYFMTLVRSFRKTIKSCEISLSKAERYHTFGHYKI